MLDNVVVLRLAIMVSISVWIDNRGIMQVIIHIVLDDVCKIDADEESVLYSEVNLGVV